MSRVLVVDDDLVALEGMRRLLLELGHTVTVATSGTAALEAIVPERPDVILCDLGLPDVDGFEIAVRLRADPRTSSTRLVAVTGYRRMAGNAAQAAGFDEYLLKPINAEAIRKAVGDA